MSAADDYRAAACLGKISFATFTQAKHVAERGTRRGKSRQIYHCPHCRQFHLGRRPFLKRQGRITTEEP
jgi:hypothetical protein